MESLLAFIPEDRRLALAGGYELPDRAEGSVLFADISGFTPLTAALAQELGVQRGAEEVLNQINPVYEAIIAELHRFGGSVMGFAGDSITCWLDGDAGQRAVACALAMQSAMRPFATVKTPGGTPITLAIKVAVAAGPARRFVVGDPGIQLIDVLAGRTLDHVASAEKLANKGEVVVGGEVVAALGDTLDILEWRKGAGGERFAVVDALRALPDATPHPLLLPGALTEEEARPWALQPVFRRMQAGGKFLAELRPSVALFLKFSGIDYDGDDEAGRKLDAFVCWLQATIQQQEGFLIQLTMGDKGSYAYASFGAPLAHDDDSTRAVAAALDLLALPPDLDYVYDLQIGISRGRVWAGECGARLGAGFPRYTYGVMGNEVNMAARLMGKAHPGQILVRRRVADEAQQAFQFQSLGLMTVKGGAEPIPVAEVLGRQQTRPWQSDQYNLPLVGRQTELQQLQRLLDGALAGQGQLVTLQGPTGVGKSHLAADFRQYASASGFQVVAGTCQRIFSTTSYLPWQQALRELLGVAGSSGPGADAAAEAAAQAEIVENTLTQMNPDWSVRVPLLRDILGLPLADNPTTAAFDPKQRRDTLIAFVIDIVRAWSRSQPLLFVFENSHWMDETSRSLLEAVAKSAPDMPLMILVVTRPASETDSEADALVALHSLDHHHLVSLSELTADGIGQLVANLLGNPPSLFARLLIEAKAQGNPFFTHELVDTLRESGQLVLEEGEWVLSPRMIDALRTANALVRDAGTWVLAQTADLSAISLGIPDSMHGIILARLDRLPDTHKPTIKVASVIGYTFELGLLAQVHPGQLGERALQDQANTLQERDFIVAERPQPTWQAEAEEWQSVLAGRYSFRQHVTQEVSYETLLYTQRRELHCNLAELLEGRSPEAVDQIAYHAYLGEDWARTMRYHLLAGIEDKKLFANLQSLDHFRKALVGAERLPAEGTAPQRREIHAELGELLLTIGQIDDAFEHLRRSLALAESLGDQQAQANACRWLARAHEQRGEFQPALEWIDRGLAVLGDLLTPSSLELRLMAGLIHTRQGEYKLATQQALASMLAAEELGEPSIVARAHTLLGTIDRLRGRLENAGDHFEEALTLYRQIGNLQGEALAENALANALFARGKWSEADTYYRKAGQIFSQLGNNYNRVLVDNNLGGIALNQGRLDEALHFYRRALQALEQIGGSLYVMGALNGNLGATHTRRGETAIAFEHLEKSRELFERANVREQLPELHRLLAEAYLSKGELDRARHEAERSLAVAEELSMLAEQGLTLRVLGVIAASVDDFVQADAYLNRAIDVLTQVGDEFGLASAQLALAELSTADLAQRESLLRQCVPTFDRLGAAPEMERARQLLVAQSDPLGY